MLRCSSLLLCACVCGLANAADDATLSAPPLRLSVNVLDDPVQSPAGADSVYERGILDRGREGVRAVTLSVARHVDSWFGNKPFEQGGRVSGSIGFNLLAREDDGPKGNVRFRARLDLPNVKEQGYLFFGQDNERELVRDQPDPFTRHEQLLTESRRNDLSYFAGIGVALKEWLELRAGVRSGYKPYAQARYRKRWSLAERDSLDFRETFFWTVKDGVGATTALDYSHAFAPSLSLRWRAAGTFSHDHEGLGWSTGVGMFKTFEGMRALSLEALANGDSGARVRVAEYGVRTVWRQPVYRDWTFADVTVGYFWPQKEEESERGQSWAVGLGIEILF